MNHNEYRYKKDDVVNGYIILEQSRKNIKSKYSNKRKSYICMCKKCGYINNVEENKILQGRKCPVCSNQIVISGINDVYTTNKEILIYFKNIEEAKTVSYGSNKKIKCRCPNCGYEKELQVNLIKNFSCPICNDKISYPEKFLTNFLIDQLNVKNFEKEKTFDWSQNKRYDFYIPNLSCIIETHGLQHYLHTGFNRTLEEEQENDKLKEQLAKENGIKYYIILDCGKSEMEWIKNSILNSELNELFDLSSIDWEKCDLNSKKSNIILSCNMWNNGFKIKEIAQKLKLNRTTIRRYLKQGSKNNLCNYNSEVNKNKIIFSNKIQNSKKVKCLETNKIYNSYTECAQEMTKEFKIKFSSSHIGKVCSGERKHHRNFHFENINIIENNED